MLNVKYHVEKAVLKQLLDYLMKDPEQHLSSIVSLLRKVDTGKLYTSQFDMVEELLKEEDNNWVELMTKLT